MMVDRYDVCRVRQVGKKSALAVVLQNTILDQLKTVVVAPLLDLGKIPRIKRLHPILTLNGSEFIVAVDLMVAVDRRNIVEIVTSADQLADEIQNALDLVFIGF
jgi:hypothetical protein